MTDEIIENIKITLNKPIEKERVVYIIIEVRKFIERNKETSLHWFDLKYWCDWTAHTHLSGGFAIDTLSKMEKFIINNPGKKFNHNYFNVQFVSLESFRKQFINFLKSNGLPVDISNTETWRFFVKYLVETLRDCPLQKSTGLVRKFQFTKQLHIPEYENFSIDWRLSFDGSLVDLNGSVLIHE